MKYKIVVKTRYSTYVKEKSKNKDMLLKKAELLSKKNPSWRIFVVAENTII